MDTMTSNLSRQNLLLLLALGMSACATPASPNPGGGTGPADAASDLADSNQAGDAAEAGDAEQGGDTSTEADAGDGAAADAGACLAGSSCDDGDKCTTQDSCLNGQCVGQPRDCSLGLSPCQKGACEPGSGLCLTSDGDGTCDDGDPCTQSDNCLLGACVGFKMQGCCTVDCDGKKCGDDGCGGLCGSCGDGEVCGSGACVASNPAGETCADAMAIGSLPFSHSGTTADAKNDLQAPDKACYNAALGTYGPDVVPRRPAVRAGAEDASGGRRGAAGGCHRADRSSARSASGG
jgi:hypothetical protein